MPVPQIGSPTEDKTKEIDHLQSKTRVGAEKRTIGGETPEIGPATKNRDTTIPIAAPTTIRTNL